MSGYICKRNLLKLIVTIIDSTTHKVKELLKLRQQKFKSFAANSRSWPYILQQNNTATI